MQSVSIALSTLMSREQYCRFFSVRLKSPKLTDRLRNSVGSEFQTVGPATEKTRRPNVILLLCYFNAHSGPGNNNNWLNIFSAYTVCTRVSLFTYWLKQHAVVADGIEPWYNVA